MHMKTNLTKKKEAEERVNDDIDDDHWDLECAAAGTF